jgi:hypothetical protein
MKQFRLIAGSALGVVFLTGLSAIVPGLRLPANLQAVAQNARGRDLIVDVAIDCRTFVDVPGRGGVFILNGKIFPARTLASGTTTNYPTDVVNGVAPIGETLVRGQHALPLPPAIASSYSSIPFDFATQYFILNDGRALTTDGYVVSSNAVPLAITGGIGGFQGASGQVEGTIIGTNATGCPNARVKFNLQPGFGRD